MKKKIFSKKLYSEMMKQQRMAALIFISICLVASVIRIVIEYTSWGNMKEINPTGYATYAPFNDALAIAPILFVFMYLGGLLLPFGAFSFLNKRSSSDFFHSIPYSRTCVFVSTVLATLTWVAITIFSTLLATVLGCIFTGMTFYYSFLPPLIITLLIGTAMMCSIATLGMTITGTRFSNLIIFGLILFLPRFIMALSASGILTLARILPSSAELGLLNASYNIPVGMFLSALGLYPTGIIGNTSLQIVYSYASWIYSAVCTLIYFGLGLYAYNVRKSETAGTSALSKFMQTVYRIAIALPPMIVLGMLIVLSEGSIEGYLVLTTISLFAYFLFELITTKSAKKMLKAAPFYLVVLLVAALVTGGMCLTATAKKNVKVDAADVRAVSIKQNEHYYEGYLMDYGTFKASEVEFDDAEIIELAVKGLSYTVDGVQKENFPRTYPAHQQIVIEFHMKSGKTFARRLFLPEKDYMKINEVVAKNKKFIEAYLAFPSDKEIDKIAVTRTNSFSQEQVKALWEIYKEEVSKLTDDKRMRLKSLNPEYAFFVKGMINSKTTHLFKFIFSQDITPATFKEYIRLNGLYKDFNEFLLKLDMGIKIAKECGDLNSDMYYGHFEMTATFFAAMPDIFPTQPNSLVMSNYSIDTFIRENPDEIENYATSWLDDFRKLISRADVAQDKDNKYIVSIHIWADEDKSEEERKEEGKLGYISFIEEEIFLELTQSEYEKLFKLFNEYTQMYELVSDSGVVFPKPSR